MAPITTGSHPKALWPGVESFFGMKYNEHPMEWPALFEVKSSSKQREEQVESTSFGLAPIKGQAGSVHYDSHTQGGTATYIHVAYGLGYIVTHEELADNLYKSKSFNRSEALAFSGRQTEETVGANVLNRAFNASYTGADGSALVVSDHTTPVGNQANLLSTASDFNEGALEDMLIDIFNAQNSRGRKIALRGMKLCIPTALAFEAERVLASALQSGTANNDINAVRSMGLLPQGAAMNHYFTDPDAWFIKTDAPTGLTRFNREAVSFTQDNDFDTMNAKAKMYIRFSVKWGDWRTIYASPGT